MKSKVWNKIFRNKSSKSSPSPEKDIPNEVDGHEHFSQNIAIMPGSSATLGRSAKPSKISKMVNTFTLKRNSNKENASGYNADVAISIIRSNESNMFFNRDKSERKNKHEDFVPIMDTTRTPTTAAESPLSIKSDYNNAVEALPPEPANMALEPCPICNRTFVPATLEKHVGICEKMNTKKRNIFDSSRQRIEGTELAAYIPKGFGLPQTKQVEPKFTSKVEMSTPIAIHRQLYEEPQFQRQNSLTSAQKKATSPVSQITQAQKAEIKARAEAKRHIQPTTDQCPYCARYFGLKAYDRHVEWCREKARIAAIKNHSEVSVGKERLEARTKYRAPNLKLKRAAIRDKYSNYGDDGHSIDGNRMDDFLSMSNSLSSSFMSDGGYSDKYDPFLSAKRQLEELCSPISTTFPNTSPLSPNIKSPTTPITPLILKPKLTSTPMSTSYTATSSNPRNTLNAVKSNFRRTSSLRAPRKVTPCSRPLFVPPSRSRPTTIQRGISDEGPISSNFIKPEEYDEMPVKSACINNFATAIHSPRSMRDPSPRLLSTSRESSPNTFKRDGSPFKRDPSPLIARRDPSPLIVRRDPSPLIARRDPSPIVVRRDASTNLNRRNLRLNLSNDQENSSPNNIQKTDSLAVFLKYENELVKDLANNPIEPNSPQQFTRTSSAVVTEKDLKDKTNILSKQNSLKNSSSDLVEKAFGSSNERERLSTMKLPDANNSSRNQNYDLRPQPIENCMTVNKILPIKLEPLPKSVMLKNTTSNIITRQSSSTSSSFTPTLAPLFPTIKPNSNNVNLNSILSNANDSKEPDNFIDPKLINACDNLKVTAITKFESDSLDELASTSSHDSINTTKLAPRHNLRDENQNVSTPIDIDLQSQTKRLDQYKRQPSSNRNSSEKKNLLKRQIRLGKNQFLYDASPSDSESSPDPITKDQNSRTISTTTTTTTTMLPLIDSEKEFDSLLSPSNNPIFNDFDFEQFLSNFEAGNDEEQFPGFKDCKEFLMNRCLNMRSNNFSNLNNLTNNTPIHSVRSQKHESEQNVENKKRSQIEDEKHEIFISIETDQNDNETMNPCPNDPSIKNPKVEEVNSNDNKFTKIETYHLPIFEEEKYDNLLDFEVKSIPRSKIVSNLIREENEDEDEYEKIMEKNIELVSNTLYPADSDEISSVECYPVGRRSVKSKASSDSAYGSLSRHSPTSTDRSSIHRTSGRNQLPSASNTPDRLQSSDCKRNHNRELSGSSSGSENSLPPINSHQLHKQNSREKTSLHETNIIPDPFKGSTDSVNGQLSKFCHECGFKFLVSQAKFCMECGVKRIVIK